MSAMSLLQRVSSSISNTRLTLPHTRLAASVIERVVLDSDRPRHGDGHEPTRTTYPGGVFAALHSEPAEAAEIAYTAFAHHALTPTLAEREVLRALRGHAPRCRPVETAAAYCWDLAQFEDGAGKVSAIDHLRIFVRHLVRMQLIHETNVRELQRLRTTREARRVRLLSGCCPVCDELAQSSYRVSSAPALPVPGCQRHGGCVCGWVGV